MVDDLSYCVTGDDIVSVMEEDVEVRHKVSQETPRGVRRFSAPEFTQTRRSACRRTPELEHTATGSVETDHDYSRAQTLP